MITKSFAYLVKITWTVSSFRKHSAYDSSFQGQPRQPASVRQSKVQHFSSLLLSIKVLEGLWLSDTKLGLELSDTKSACALNTSPNIFKFVPQKQFL